MRNRIKRCFSFTSAIDDRIQIGQISSRIGLKREAKPIDDDMNIYKIVKKMDQHPDCVLIDEYSFFKKTSCAAASRNCRPPRYTSNGFRIEK